MKDLVESAGPHTEGGREDMLTYGKCLERQDADGSWHHIPVSEWMWPPPEEPVWPFSALLRAKDAP